MVTWDLTFGFECIMNIFIEYVSFVPINAFEYSFPYRNLSNVQVNL